MALDKTDCIVKANTNVKWKQSWGGQDEYMLSNYLLYRLLK